ncbi:uncharacterized protein V1510DRAFT_430901 [Dipodascopsis tothii]|uniref:uncharacterized protein n=1 Tax=Dipodascopsis tothii TaxID=44089 RepID=UPI0034CFB17C
MENRATVTGLWKRAGGRASAAPAARPAASTATGSAIATATSPARPGDAAAGSSGPRAAPRSPADLPAEILTRIVVLALPAEPGAFLAAADTLAGVCRAFRTVLRATEHDGAVYRPLAARLGLPGRLDAVVCGGTGARRTWRGAVAAAARLSRPPRGQGKLPPPRVVRAREGVPAPRGVRRSFELVVAAEGRAGAAYAAAPLAADDGGEALVAVGAGGEVAGRVLSGTRPGAAVYAAKGGVADDGAAADIVLEVGAGGVTATQYTVAGAAAVWRFPLASGRAPAAAPAPALPDRASAAGSRLVLLYAPTMVFFWSHPADSPARLRCYDAAGGAGRSRLAWTVNLAADWAVPSRPRELFPVVQSFVATSTKVAALVHWYPIASVHSVSSTSFRILSAASGQTLQVLAFDALSPAALAPFSSAAHHNFVFTDTHLVSGGPGGHVHVFDHAAAKPAAMVPAGAGAGMVPCRHPVYTLPAPRGFPQVYNALALSRDGDWLVATGSNRAVVWNMRRKTVDAVYVNRRKVARRDLGVRNPFDAFPAGVWAWVRDRDAAGAVRRDELVFLPRPFDPAPVGARAAWDCLCWLATLLWLLLGGSLWRARLAYRDGFRGRDTGAAVALPRVC